MTTFSLLLKLAIVIFIGLLVAFLVWLWNYEIPERKIDPDDVVAMEPVTDLSAYDNLPVFVSPNSSMVDAVRVAPETYLLLAATNLNGPWEIARTLEGPMPSRLSTSGLPYEEYFHSGCTNVFFRTFQP